MAKKNDLNLKPYDTSPCHLSYDCKSVLRDLKICCLEMRRPRRYTVFNWSKKVLGT